MIKATTTLAATLVAIALPIAAPAAAGEAESVTVDYSDLNLATVQGNEILERRLSNAVEQVCDYKRQERNPNRWMSARKCVQEISPIVEEKRQFAVANYGTERVAITERKIRFARRQTAIKAPQAAQFLLLAGL